MRVRKFAVLGMLAAFIIGCGGGSGEPIEVIEQTHENGNPREVIRYQGKRDNVIYRAFFSPDGNKMSEQELQNNKPHGKRVVYFADGSISQETYFQDSLRHGSDKSWHANGQLRSEAEFENGAHIGRFVTYFEDGKVESEVSFQDGRKHGEETEYFASGNKRRVRTFENGLQNGPEIEYFDDARNSVKARRMYENNALNGPYETFHPNGRVEERGTYINGQWDGVRESFNAQGRSCGRAEYDKGVRTKAHGNAC